MTSAFSRLRSLAPPASRGDPRRVVLVAALLILLGGIFPAYLGIELTRGLGAGRGPGFGAGLTLADMMGRFERQGFNLAEAAEPPLMVPRVFLARLPHDWPELTEPKQRKQAFITALLPLVLRANEILLEQRGRLLGIAADMEQGKRIAGRDRAWTQALAARYGLEAPEITAKVLRRLTRAVDMVPPSLAIAQGAIESGWGTSRFAAEGNALYGQWAEEGEGAMVPAERDAGRSYAIKSFETLQDSVLAYMHNLNTHRAYRQFRAARAEMRQAGRPIAGAALAKYLGAYSERGERYIRDLTAIIAQNRLGALDGAALRGRRGRDLLTTSGPAPRT